jgi:hypothetical protein
VVARTLALVVLPAAVAEGTQQQQQQHFLATVLVWSEVSLAVQAG